MRLEENLSIRPFYRGWQTYNQRLIDVIRPMSADQLAIRPAPERAPIWATVGHTAGTRVYWLCIVFKEPGADTTPFADAAAGVGWEDDEDHPRGPDELVNALETTWAIVDRCLIVGRRRCCARSSVASTPAPSRSTRASR